MADARAKLRVVLVRTRNPLNLGAAARAMSNFGFGRLRVVNPYEVAYREARSAVGAGEVLAAAEEYKSVAEAVADCALVVGTTAVGHRHPEQPVRNLDQCAADLRGHPGPVALLFGSEKVGLSSADLSHCHWLLRIPTVEEHISMNLGQAVAVCLYELARDAAAARAAEAKMAPAEMLERLTQAWLEALRLSGYVKAEASRSSEAGVRRLLRRVNLRVEDAELMLGFLRQILWKLRQP